MNFKPMLSASLPSAKMSGWSTDHMLADLEKLEWDNKAGGFLCSPKIDGIRAVHMDGTLVSRTLKKIPNKYIHRALDQWSKDYELDLDGLDGELVRKGDDDVDDYVAWNQHSYNDNQSFIMSQDSVGEFYWLIFDDYKLKGNTFRSRYQTLRSKIENIASKSLNNPIKVVPQVLVTNVNELMEYEEEMFIQGFEGIIIRHPLSDYKFGRSTFKQQGMIKIKPCEDAEAEIIGFEELERNNNKATIDSRGYQVRGSSKEHKVAANTLGNFVIKVLNGRFEGIETRCGSGLDDKTRDEVWNNQDKYIKRIIKFKYQPHGSKNAPRQPIFLGFRSKDDM